MTAREASFTRRDFLKAAGATGASVALAGALAGCSGTSSNSSSEKKEEEPKTQTVTDMGGTDVEAPTNPTKYADG